MRPFWPEQYRWVEYGIGAALLLLPPLLLGAILDATLAPDEPVLRPPQQQQEIPLAISPTVTAQNEDVVTTSGASAATIPITTAQGALPLPRIIAPPSSSTNTHGDKAEPTRAIETRPDDNVAAAPATETPVLPPVKKPVRRRTARQPQQSDPLTSFFRDVETFWHTGQTRGTTSTRRAE